MYTGRRRRRDSSAAWSRGAEARGRGKMDSWASGGARGGRNRGMVERGLGDCSERRVMACGGFYSLSWLKWMRHRLARLKKDRGGLRVCLGKLSGELGW